MYDSALQTGGIKSCRWLMGANKNMRLRWDRLHCSLAFFLEAHALMTHPHDGNASDHSLRINIYNPTEGASLYSESL
jgi:competence CoiA-like predicted nuclease